MIFASLGWLSNWWFILLVLNAIIGLLLLDKAWKNTIRFRCPPSQELEDLFPAFRRKDALIWKKWKLYPGAMFLLVPRFILLILLFVIEVFFIKIFMIWHKDGEALSGCRKCLVNATLQFFTRLQGVFAFGAWHSYKYLREDEVDYSEYLGTNELMPVESSIGGVMKEFYS